MIMHDYAGQKYSFFVGVVQGDVRSKAIRGEMKRAGWCDIDIDICRYLPFLMDEREICEAVRETGSLLLAKGGKREE